MHIQVHQDILDNTQGLSEEQILRLRRHLEAHKQIMFFAQKMGGALGAGPTANGPQASMAPAQEQNVDANGMMGQDKPMGGESSVVAE